MEKYADAVNVCNDCFAFAKVFISYSMIIPCLGS